MTKHPSPIPMYPDEDRIALEVMGPKRAKEWPSKAKYLEEKHGLPPIDELMGGRFWPAVVQYFKARHGISLPGAMEVGHNPPAMNNRVRVVPFRPDGKEVFDVPEAQTPPDRRHRGRHHGPRV